ncbi:PI-PLC domain-containing protein [Saccharicrinis fermentans]|nr:hypothetical protein [Saccharicrinis fermentans]
MILLLLCVVSMYACHPTEGLKIKGGHSHNDYYHPRPLFDALRWGMVSVEADVFPVGDRLLVGHSLGELSEYKSLEELYLMPLYELYRNKQLDTLILMVDIKEKGEESYRILESKLDDYRPMLSVFAKHRLQKNHVTIILSGDRPSTIFEQTFRYCALDGRIDSISFAYDYTFYPLVSDNWEKHFSWDGEGAMTPHECQKLRDIVNQCHEQHKLLRFWNTPGRLPQSLSFWQLFQNEKVDLMGVDKPDEFNAFLND